MIRVFSLSSVCFLFILQFGCRSDHGYRGAEAIKYEQYLFQGQQLYTAHCLNCHQKDGSGLGKLIPPLTTDFLVKERNLTICGIKHGLEGPLEINGTTYNGVMPNNPRLTPLEIAEIMTYIGNSWGNKCGMVKIQTVEAALSKCNN